MRRIASTAVLVLALCGGISARAHEFWISPDSYQVAPGEAIRAELRVGQNFKGAGYAYLPDRTTRFDLVTDGGTSAVASRMGDRPALNQPAPAAGLLIVVHETDDSQLTYTEWPKFTGFVEHKGFDGVLETHQARNLPQTGFRESYRRFAKSLIAIGDGAGSDRVVGLTTEIVALANPYTDDMTGGLPVQVLHLGRPRPNAQLEVFDRAPDGAVTDTRLRADADGRVLVPVSPGHEYLLDAVLLEDTGNDDLTAGPVWRSLWASLTFRVPAE